MALCAAERETVIEKKPREELMPDIEMYGDYDVVVAGGGPAGVCAGLAAARQGAKTLLVEQFNCLGGMATTGLHQHIGVFMGEGGCPEIVGGLPREIGQRAEENWGASFGGRYLDVEIEGFKCLLDEMAGEAGLDVLFYSLVVDVILEEGRAAGVVMSNKSGLFLAEADRIVDCTGDADVAFRAGCPVNFGRPEDERTQPGTLMFRLGGVDWDKLREYREDDPLLEDFCQRAVKEDLMRPWQSRLMGFWYVPSRPDQVGVNFTHMHFDGTSASELSSAAMTGRRQVQEAVRAMKALLPGFEDAYLIDTAVQMGVRETRRIVGSYILTEDDIREQKIFEDSIGLGSAYVDIHNVDGPGMDKRSGFSLPEGGYYSIPYRTLVPQEVDNLLVAGRCHSCTHEAAGSTRWITQCMVMGQAAGTAAALSAREEVSPRELDVSELQRKLQNDGAILD
ncbi:MAG: FAD-dependent oxidoreductase [Planctomycetes bacterium]|nr:FAD-dependent oxidoreductase [Planctomycetota bacterium]